MGNGGIALSISTTSRKAGPFAGNGVTTAFPFTFKVFADTDLLVVTATGGIETTKVISTDYSVALNADQDASPGGTINMVVAPAVGTTLAATSAVPQLQPVTVANNGGFFPAVFNTVFDRLTILIQQLAQSIGRTLTIPLTATGVTSLQIPVLANALIGWNSAATALTVFDYTAGNLPAQIGNAGKYLTTDGVNASWGTIQLLPTQTGNAGKYLTTDGNNASWVAPAVTPPGPAQGRLTLTTGVPVTTTDVSASNTVYYTPFCGDRIPLYDGAKFVPTAFTELANLTTDATKNPAACANNTNYDLFVWDDAGTLRLSRGPAWSSDTARAAGGGLTLLNGIYVNTTALTNGPAASRGTYVGSVRTNGSATIDDTLVRRVVWNRYNRVSRGMRVTDAAASWTYSTATFRAANNNSANRFETLCGLVEDTIRIVYHTNMSNNTSAGGGVGGVGVNTTTTNGATGDVVIPGGTPYVYASISNYDALRLLGFNYYSAIERGEGPATTTFYGQLQSQMIGSLMQ